jgi:hypothetical protein
VINYLEKEKEFKEIFFKTRKKLGKNPKEKNTCILVTKYVIIIEMYCIL